VQKIIVASDNTQYHIHTL